MVIEFSTVGSGALCDLVLGFGVGVAVGLVDRSRVFVNKNIIIRSLLISLLVEFNDISFLCFQCVLLFDVLCSMILAFLLAEETKD